MRNITRAIATASVAILATIALGTPSAGAIDSKCMYPPSKAALSVGLSTTAPTAGQPVYVRGRLSYNRCGAAGSPITVRSGGKTIGSRTTDAAGNYSVRFTPNSKTSVYAAGSFNRAAVKSRTLGVLVRTNLRSTKAVAIGSCKVTVKGTIFPVRKGATVLIQQRLTKGKTFTGWRTIATTRTSAKGAYGTVVTLPCAAKSGLSTYIAPTKANAANRSTTINVTARK